MEELMDLSVERTFHGIIYYININATVESLTIEIEQKTNGDSWLTVFQSSYIEEITQKTGNFKKYSVFLKMLQSAINSQTESVYIDILTYQDLEHIKNKRKQQGNQIVQSNKRYLILSYIVEFDKVHYPLPLQFNEAPNVQNLKNTIIKLRNDNETLNKQILSYKSTLNTSDILQEQAKEIEFLKGMLEQKEREVLELKNLHHQNQSTMIKKSEYNELRTKYLTTEQNNQEIYKKISELEDCLSQVIDENQQLKSLDKKNKTKITTLEQELQSALSSRVKPRNITRSPSVSKVKQQSIQSKKKSAEKTTPIRQRKPSIDSDTESSFRRKTNQKRIESPSARSNSSKKSNSKQVLQKQFKKTITKTEDQDEQRLLQRLKDLRERNKENALQLTTPTSRIDQSSCEDLTSIDERLGKLTNLLRKVKQQ